MDNSITTLKNLFFAGFEIENKDKLHSIIKLYQPISKRGITRLTRSMRKKERNEIIFNLLENNNISAEKNGKLILFRSNT